MRSSLDEALLFFNRFKATSSRVRLLASVGEFDVSVDGLIDEASRDSLRVRGPDSVVSVKLGAAPEFEYSEPGRELPAEFRPAAVGIGSFWQVTLVSGDFFVLAEIGV